MPITQVISCARSFLGVTLATPSCLLVGVLRRVATPRRVGRVVRSVRVRAHSSTDFFLINLRVSEVQEAEPLAVTLLKFSLELFFLKVYLFM